MNIFFELLLILLKYALPTAIITYAAYRLLGMYMENQRQLKSLELRKDNKHLAFPMRMQAYERLALFCERISLGNLILRVRDEGMDTADLRLALMVAIQQEYEHNLSQQVYVSEKLWKIVTFAKNDTINAINLVSQTLGKDTSSLEFSHALFRYLDERKETPLDTARSAISQEAANYLA